MENTSARHAGRSDLTPLPTLGHRLRVPILRGPLPRRATLPRLRGLLPSSRSRWSLPALRRAGRRQRSPRHWKRRWPAHTLTLHPARQDAQLASLACRAFVPQAWLNKGQATCRHTASLAVRTIPGGGPLPAIKVGHSGLTNTSAPSRCNHPPLDATERPASPHGKRGRATKAGQLHVDPTIGKFINVVRPLARRGEGPQIL